MKKTISQIYFALRQPTATHKDGICLPAIPISNPDDEIEILLTDSRSLIYPRKSLFFAISTEGNDGHRFIDDLYDRGVRNFVVNHIPEGMKWVSDANFLVVEDTTAALQYIAANLDGFHGEMLAITGSRGKTTLKEWLFQLLEPLRTIARSPRSYNSQIGVPLSLWEINPDTELAIIEAGVSRHGEMQTLANIIRPDVVIVTNVGDEHSEGFNSIEEKAAEKVRLAATGSTRRIIYDADSEVVRSAIDTLPQTVERISISRTDPTATLFAQTEPASIAPSPGDEAKDCGGCEVKYTYGGETSTLHLPLGSDADIQNELLALAYMLSEGYARNVIAERFRHLHRIGTRLDVVEGVNNCNIIHDSYTSDFSSLLPALDFMKRRSAPGSRLTVVMSDLRHEADSTPDAIATLMRDAGVDRFIGIGSVLAKSADRFGNNALFFEDVNSMLVALSTSDFDNETILLKGAPEYHFERILEMLEARKHETVLEVNLDSIVSNFNYFRNHLPKGTGLIAMVKASGYGAGSYEIARTMQEHGAAYLAVAVLDEGIDLRRRGITMPIMVMNPKVVNYKSMFANNLEPEIYSLEMLHDVIREGAKYNVKNYPVHIKLDTGMHRMGFIEEELPIVMEILEGQDIVTIKSVFSHLATADCPDMDDYTLAQLELFDRLSSYIQSRSHHRILRHVLNSAGILRFPQYHYDMARLGIGLYGVNTLPPEMEEPLAVVSSLRTVIIAIREWEPGTTIGYGRHGMITRPSRIATIPIGYADGMNRHFGRGNVSVIVNGKPAPTIGNICMDACMIDVTDIECQVGDEVEIFGSNAPVERLAEVLDTIPYEILTSVSPRVKRIYYRE